MARTLQEMTVSPKEPPAIPTDAGEKNTLTQPATPAKHTPRKRKKVDLTHVERLASAGLTEHQMCLALDITPNQLKGWKGRAEFKEALKRGRDQRNEHVERTLYQRATGFVYEELTYEAQPLIPARGNQKAVYDPTAELIVVRRVVKTAIPDTMALMFFLNNNLPDKYKNRNDSNVTTTQVVKVQELEGVTITSIRKAKEAILAKLKKDQDQALVQIKPEQRT